MDHSLYVPESALVVTAHPDDIEFSCAGTLARWAKSGARIAYVLCTSGEVGIAEPGMTRERAARLREAETQEAAVLVGASEVVFLREPDGLLVATLELRKRLVREIRRFRPEVVVTGDPTIVWAGEDYINHPDHRAAAAAALDAVFPAAGQPNLFEELQSEGFSAHKVRKVFITTWEGGDTAIDISQTLETKIAALRAHKSQMGDWNPADLLSTWAREAGKPKGMDYAEIFRVITLVDDQRWEATHGKV